MLDSFKQSIKDLSGTAVASIVATALDGVVFGLLQWFGAFENFPLSTTGLHAVLGALAGGITHYSLCRFWVFSRFESSVSRSFALYMAMSLTAALLHGAFTGGLTLLVPSGTAWVLSKVALYLAWTYPLSRYVVFAERQPEDPQEGSDAIHG